MWISEVTRKELLEIFELAGESTPVIVSRRTRPPGAFRPTDHVLIWKNDPKLRSELPVGLLLSPGSVNDFLAWASTYLQSVRPFTAFCRVTDDPKGFDESVDEINLNGLQDAYLGLIFGESLLSSQNRSNVKPLTLLDCMS